MSSLYESHGALELPFEAADVSDTELTFAPADPAQRVLLDLISTALASEMGPAWSKVTNSLPATHPLYGTAIVQSKLPAEPTEMLVKQTASPYPALYVHRTGEAQLTEWTLELHQRTQQWLVHWIIGGLDAGAQQKLQGALQRVGDVVQSVIRNKRHPDYNSGHVSLTTSTDGLTSIRVLNAAAGAARFAAEEQTFLASVVTLESQELVELQTSQLSTFGVTTFDVSLGDPDDDPLETFIELDTDYVP